MSLVEPLDLGVLSIQKVLFADLHLFVACQEAPFSVFQLHMEISPLNLRIEWSLALTRKRFRFGLQRVPGSRKAREKSLKEGWTEEPA